MMKLHFAAQYATGLGTVFPKPEDIVPAVTQAQIELEIALDKTNKFLSFDGQVSQPSPLPLTKPNLHPTPT